MSVSVKVPNLESSPKATVLMDDGLVLMICITYGRHIDCPLADAHGFLLLVLILFQTEYVQPYILTSEIKKLDSHPLQRSVDGYRDGPFKCVDRSISVMSICFIYGRSAEMTVCCLALFSNTLSDTPEKSKMSVSGAEVICVLYTCF